LNAREILETQSTYRRYFAFGCVGLLSIAIAWISILLKFSVGAILAGVVYNLIWVIVIFEGRKLKREILILENDLQTDNLDFSNDVE
jgi:Flp pilus assembly protein TadB